MRIVGFVIVNRAVDKCRAGMAGTLGDYIYDGPLDNLLFDFKGITSAEFQAVVQGAAHYGLFNGMLCFSAILIAVAFITAVPGFVVLAGTAAFVLRLCFVGSFLLFVISLARRKKTRL